MDNSRKPIRTIAITGAAIIVLILVAGTIWMSHAARLDTDRAIRKVSLLYLDELAGRREQVVEANLDNRIETIEIAVGLMTDDDLATEENRQAYQARMKALYLILALNLSILILSGSVDSSSIAFVIGIVICALVALVGDVRRSELPAAFLYHGGQSLPDSADPAAV